MNHDHGYIWMPPESFSPNFPKTKNINKSPNFPLKQSSSPATPQFQFPIKKKKYSMIDSSSIQNSGNEE